MVMNNIEYDAVVESAKIKAKSDITVAVLNNAASTGLVAINDASKEKLIRVGRVKLEVRHKPPN
ncbi:hypothetical protein APD18_06645 [Acinetobacter baumannii]|nr:hypothetical protein APD18_06645 [Acinetobacter baumannii]